MKRMMVWGQSSDDQILENKVETEKVKEAEA